MRGIPTIPSRHRRHRRISPAHAGNTESPVQGQGAAGDQPRTCGEYWITALSATAQTGSAPHMRGIPWRARSHALRAGISPAHAGNTILRSGDTIP